MIHYYLEDTLISQCNWTLTAIEDECWQKEKL